MNRTKEASFPSVKSIFDDAFEDDFFPRPRFWRNKGLNLPTVNVKENSDNYEMEVSAPGFKKEDFQVKVDNGVLIISNSSEKESETKEENYTRKEFFYNSFSRSFLLPENASEEDLEAKYEDGILKVFVGKEESEPLAKAKEIQIN